MQIGNDDVQRQTRKPAAGADIEQIGTPCDETGRGERIKEMVACDRLRVRDGREIGDRIPFQELLCVAGKETELLCPELKSANALHPR